MARSAIEPVRHAVEVALPAARAFELFIDQIDTWWPLASHSVGGVRATGCYVEGRTGGRIFETLEDGTLQLWGTVSEWDPPRRIVFSWHPGRDAATAQEIELAFIEEGGSTRVELCHRGWEALGERATEARERYHSGWPGVLAHFQDRARAIPAQ